METGRHSRSSFFRYLRAWSRIKLRILENYLKAYLNKRGRFNPTIYYVDGYAGPGVYGDGESAAEEGSPLRIARLAQERRDSGRPGKLVCKFVESDPDNCRNLQNALSSAGIDADLYYVYCGTFQKHILAIVGLMEPGPAVCFLDPFGVNGISPADLLPLLERPNTEFLMNLNTGILRRMAGFEDSEAKDRDAKLANVTKTLGEDPSNANPAWLEMWHRLNDSRQWEEWAAQEYMQRLVGLSPDLKYAMCYGVRAAYRTRPKYYLVFASRAPDAFPIMNDFLCSEEDHLFASTEAIGPGGQTSFLVPLREQERGNRLRELAEEIHVYGLQHQGVRGAALLQHFTFERFGEFRKSHWRRAVELLVEEGRVKRSNGRFEDAHFEFV